MATISAQMVKELREATGAGMMDCKAALGENDGNMDAAVDWLRKKGLAKAAKKDGACLVTEIVHTPFRVGRHARQRLAAVVVHAAFRVRCDFGQALAAVVVGAPATALAPSLSDPRSRRGAEPIPAGTVR